MNSCHYCVNEDARDGVDTRKKDLTGAGADKVIPELEVPAVESGKKNTWFERQKARERKEDEEDEAGKTIAEWLELIVLSRKYGSGVGAEIDRRMRKKNACRYNIKWCRGGKHCLHYPRDPYRVCRVCGRYADPSDPMLFPYCSLKCKKEGILRDRKSGYDY